MANLDQKPLRIAFFTSHPARAGSGSERLMYDTAKAIIARGHHARVCVINSHFGTNPPFFEKQIPTLPLEQKAEYFFRRLTGWNDVLFPSTVLLRFNPWIGLADIWHFHNLHGHFVSIPLLGLWSWTKPIVISPVDQYLTTGHCPYTIDCDRYTQGCGACPRPNEAFPGISKDSTHALWLMKRLFLRLSRINVFFHTHALAAHYENTISHLTGPVIRYGIDISCYRPMSKAEAARAFGMKESDRFVVGVFHSYVKDPRKGILPIIKRLGDLSRQLPGKLELLVVGNNSEEVQGLIPPELSASHLPFLTQTHELAQAFNLCDVLLYPTHAENLSLTCLYALACGVPVISYDVGGQKEAITHGVNGFLVAVNDYKGMFDALLKLLQDPALYRKLAEGARHTSETRFDFELYIDALLLYYKNIL